MTTIDGIKAGVVFGDDVQAIFDHANHNQYALPAVNVINTCSINAALTAAKKASSPIVIQLSNGGAQFFVGKHLGENSIDAAIAGAVLAAKYIHQAARLYDVVVILHTDHAAKKLLPWIDGLLLENESYYKQNGHPLFSSHMIDLSEQPLTENISLCCSYLERMAKMDMTLELELGCTGGEEDGIDHSDIASAALYTQSEDVAYAYSKLIKVSSRFTVAASFGNVHGVYKPGNVKLKPIILKNAQAYLSEHFSLAEKPLNFVFHGGSGSSPADIKQAVSYGVVKMNIDTDTQWASWHGVKDYYQQHKDHLQSQIGNDEGDDLPNKKFYDPRQWLSCAEDAMTERLLDAYCQLNCLNRYRSSE